MTNIAHTLAVEPMSLPHIFYNCNAIALQTTSQARTILRQMEDGKLLSGQDYSTSALVSLRQTCADSGAVVKAQTPSGGDAIFRAGVEAAASAAMEPGQGASLGGASPQRFVSGLANDLGKVVPSDSSFPLFPAPFALHATISASTIYIATSSIVIMSNDAISMLQKGR